MFSLFRFFINLNNYIFNVHVVASGIWLLFYLSYSLFLINLFICISNLKAKSSTPDHWSLWNFLNYNDITDETTKYVTTVTPVMVCTKVLHNLVSKYGAKREFVETDTSGNRGILNNFPIWPKSHYGPWYFINFYLSCWSVMFRNKTDKVWMLWTSRWRRERKLLTQICFLGKFEWQPLLKWPSNLSIIKFMQALWQNNVQM